MSDEEYVKPKRWEGKPLSFKLKYLVANYPEIAICSAMSGIVIPLIMAYKLFTFHGSRNEAIKKYKFNYFVVRDNDPRAEKFRKEKEMGREFFPKY